MNRASPLAELLFARRPRFADDPRPSPQVLEHVESVLLAMIREGQAAWPGLALPPAAFVEYVTDRLEANRDVAASLSDLHAADLHLACACVAGLDRAILAFERCCFPGVDAVLARMRLPESARDEVKQVLRHRFFVGEAARPGRIVDYSGRGDLGRWVRVSAVRIAFRVAREAKASLGDGETVLAAIAAPSQDLELAFLKRTYGEAFEIALREAMASLDPRDRNLLRYHYAKGLSIDELGALYRIHRATAARRLQKVCAELFTRTRARLATNLGISGRDVSSLLRLVQSEIETAMTGLFASDRAT
jgi:RNA polymerase sigma-70 factor (ECF subfamily)